MNKNVISSYTAEEAVEDGILFNVDESMSKKVGFKIPVRITSTVFNLCLTPEERRAGERRSFDYGTVIPDRRQKDRRIKSKSGQSFEGRLWDVLSLAAFSIKRSKDDYMCTFKVKIGKMVYELWAVLDGTSGPAIHIMKPEDY
jgi:hypothetical protein